VPLTVEDHAVAELAPELIEEARFAHAGFPNDAHDLAAAGPHVV
jgi:hypothetical protein